MFHMQLDSGNHLAFVKPEITTDCRTPAASSLASARLMSVLVLLLAESCGLSSFLHRRLLCWCDLAAAGLATFAADLREVFLEFLFHAFERSTPVFQFATKMRSKIAIGNDAPRFSR